MRALVVTCLLLVVIPAIAQQDTVFIRHNESGPDDSMRYVNDTVLFPSPMMRNILTGTCYLYGTHNQMVARGYGLWPGSVTKSDCQNDGEEVYWIPDKIISAVLTDSSLVVEATIADNCCYDFLWDYSVDSAGVLNLIYHGYGTFCACDCCFGLTYTFNVIENPLYGQVKAVMINGDRRTLKVLK